MVCRVGRCVGTIVIIGLSWSQDYRPKTTCPKTVTYFTALSAAVPRLPLILKIAAVPRLLIILRTTVVVRLPLFKDYYYRKTITVL